MIEFCVTNRHTTLEEADGERDARRWLIRFLEQHSRKGGGMMPRNGMLLVLIGLVAASHLPCPALGAVTYTSGVASGDVTETGVILWTRVDQVAQLAAQVALDSGFQQLIQSLPVMASSETDFTVKIDVGGLQPETRYFYRFFQSAQDAEAMPAVS